MLHQRRFVMQSTSPLQAHLYNLESRVSEKKKLLLLRVQSEPIGAISYLSRAESLDKAANLPKLRLLSNRCGELATHEII